MTARSGGASGLRVSLIPRSHGGAIDPLELYASGIDGSDYVARVLPLLRAACPFAGDLLDVGAGGGQIGDAFREPGARWTAVEPAASMRARLAALPEPPELIAAGWEDATLARGCADTVLAANMPAPLGDAARFLARCRRWARRSIVWLVPAQNGPRGLCLAGCLPREWHGEDETPGVDIVLAALEDDRPTQHGAVDWTFSLVTPDLPALASYLADRLGWPDGDPRRPDLIDHLRDQAAPADGGLRLSVHRRSAVLSWSLS